MSERQKQTEFLRQLMRSHECDHCRELQRRIHKAERDERCVRSAVALALLLALLAASGLGYSVIFVPEFFQSPAPMSVRVFTALLLTSGICLTSFMALCWWYRGVSNNVYNECREFIISHQKFHSPAPPVTRSFSPDAPEGAFTPDALA